jgi:hypothetical protein
LRRRSRSPSSTTSTAATTASFAARPGPVDDRQCPGRDSPRHGSSMYSLTQHRSRRSRFLGGDPEDAGRRNRGTLPPQHADRVR